MQLKVNDAMQVVEEMVDRLKVVLSDSSTHQLLALDAMRYVLQLQVTPLFSSSYLNRIVYLFTLLNTHVTPFNPMLRALALE